MGVKLTWNGKKVSQQVVAGIVDGLTEVDQRIETEAKQELYPGHGVRSGTMRREIEGETARVVGDTVRGAVGVKGVKYALRMHKRYQYIVKGFRRVQPQAKAIIAAHVKRRGAK